MSTAAVAGQSRQARILVAGALALSLAVVAQGYIADHEYLLDGLLLYLLALALTYKFIPDCPAVSSPARSAAASEPLRLRGRTLLVASAFLICWVCSMLLFRTNSMLSQAWVLYATGVIGAPLSVWLAAGRPRWRSEEGASAGYMLALGLIVLVAALWRFVGLSTLPFGLWWDEAFSGLQIQRVMTDPSFRPVYVGGVAQEPALIWYVTAPFFMLFGAGALALRAAAALGGVLGVVSVYLLAGDLFGRRAGIVAAALLAVMSWHLDFSRIAFNAVWSVALDALAAYLFLRAMRTGSMVRFALAGTMLGLGANMYYTTRLLPIVLLAYLAHRLVVERGAFFRLHLGGLIVFCMVTLVTAGPLIQFAFQNPQEFGARMDQVTIFKEVASRGSLQPLQDNLRSHLLMFNYQGDGNGRHNLPSAPMLDQITGALFVLGLLMALKRGYQGSNFFALTWGVVMLAGGVFSLSFESPQGLRSIDATVAVALLASLPVAGMWEGLDRLWRGEFRLVLPRGPRQIGLPLSAIPVIALLVLIGILNYDRYFVAQATDTRSWSAFSTAETLIGREINSLGSSYAVYLGPTFTGHPTIEFLTGRKGLPAFDPVAQLPLRDAKGVALFLEPNQTEALAAVRRLYPQAEVRSFAPPAGGEPILYAIVVRQADVLRLQGMTGSYYANGNWSGEPALTEQLPSTAIELGGGLPSMPFSARWKATLSAPVYGSYRFKVEGGTSVDVLLDGSPLGRLGDTQDTVLARGNHSLVISAVITDSTPVRLLWQTPDSKQLGPISQGALFLPSVPDHGLLGSYYRNGSWSGAPAFQQIDPFLDRQIHLLPLSRPYTVEWTGRIDVPRSGSYRFATESADTSWVFIDEKQVVTNEGANRQMREGSITLDEGYHDMRVRFVDQTDHTFIRLYWTPPGGQREPLPATRLYPPQASYPPHLRDRNLPPAPQSVVPSSTPPAALKAGSVKVDFARSIGGAGGGLSDPRDVAVGPEGNIYVADSASKRVLILDPAGKQIGQMEGTFVEPFGVAVAPDGKILVLDSLGKDPVLRFNASGSLDGRLGAPIGVYSPRGITVDGAGSIYLADTGRGRVVKLSRDGQPQAEYRAGGQLAQPVSVAIGGDGSLYIVDGETHQLYVVDARDRVIRAWPVAQSTTFEAPHVAIGPQGEVYVTNPAEGIVNLYDGLGNSLSKLGGRGSGDAEFDLPTGVRFDGRGGLWVTDTRNHRIQQWTVR